LVKETVKKNKVLKVFLMKKIIERLKTDWVAEVFDSHMLLWYKVTNKVKTFIGFKYEVKIRKESHNHSL